MAEPYDRADDLNMSPQETMRRFEALNPQLTGEPIRVTKIGSVMRFSEEMLPGFVDPRLGHLEPPASEDVAAFKAWKAKFKPLFDEGARHGWFREGDEMDGFEYTPRKTGGSTTTRIRTSDQR